MKRRTFAQTRYLKSITPTHAEKPVYAVPTYKRLLDIMAVAHIYGYRKMRGRQLMRVVMDLYPEVTRGSASAALAGLSGRRYSVTEPIYHGEVVRQRYHALTPKGFNQSRFAKPLAASLARAGFPPFLRKDSVPS